MSVVGYSQYILSLIFLNIVITLSLIFLNIVITLRLSGWNWRIYLFGHTCSWFRCFCVLLSPSDLISQTLSRHMMASSPPICTEPQFKHLKFWVPGDLPLTLSINEQVVSLHVGYTKVSNLANILLTAVLWIKSSANKIQFLSFYIGWPDM